MNKKRSLVPALVVLTLSAFAAKAGDIANVHVIGFSGDGTVFSFEEYGVRDGSGHPYSNIYFLDLAKDSYLPGTPFKANIRDEDAGVGMARWQVRGEAETMIDTLEMASHPATVLAFNPVTAVDADPHRLRYLSQPSVPAVGKPNTLVLEEIQQAPDPACEGMITQAAIFKLRFTERDGQPVDQTVYSDDRLPLSRGCVSAYRLGGVVGKPLGDGDRTEVALIQVLSAGFEGQDGRWIAVPVFPPAVEPAPLSGETSGTVSEEAPGND